MIGKKAKYFHEGKWYFGTIRKNTTEDCAEFSLIFIVDKYPGSAGLTCVQFNENTSRGIVILSKLEKVLE